MGKTNPGRFWAQTLSPVAYLQIISHLQVASCEHNYLIVCIAGVPILPTQHPSERAMKALSPKALVLSAIRQGTTLGHTRTGGNRPGTGNSEKCWQNLQCVGSREQALITWVLARMGATRWAWQGHWFSAWCLQSPFQRGLQKGNSEKQGLYLLYFCWE